MIDHAAARIEALLEKPYWVIDLLPEQVPADSPGQFFAVEKHFRREPRHAALLRKRADLLLKLNCYRDFCVDGETVNPAPAELAIAIEIRYVAILVNDALITSDPDDIYITVYNPDGRLLELLGALAEAEGLFLWKPPQDTEIKD